MAHPNTIFDSFLKIAAALPAAPSSASGSAGMGDSMRRFKTERTTRPQWTAPNPSQGAPSPNPTAGQKTAPPPPVQ